MGLAEPRKRQRIDVDPQNKNWIQDNTQIGHRLLSKMGWQDGQGLGANKDGRKANIKVSLKDNNYGIGATAKTSDNWLENAFGFDNLLKGMDTDDTTFVMPETTEAPVRTLSARHIARKKYVKQKDMSKYDSKHINNILGRTTDGGDQREELAPVVENNTVEDGTIIEPITMSESKIGINDYFAMKMAQKGISFGSIGGSVQVLVTENLEPENSQFKEESKSPDQEKLQIKSKNKVSKKEKKEKKSKKSKKSKK